MSKEKRKPMKNIKAVLFDLDGTILDTEKYYRKAWPMALEHFGHTITDEQSLMFRSLGEPYLSQMTKEWFGENFDLAPIKDHRTEILKKLMADEGMEIKPGVVELLKYMKKTGIMAAIATATSYETAVKKLEGTGVLEYFDKVISARMVEKGKPAPDVYEYAAAQLGLTPQECICVEDAPNGVKSGHAAGCYVVMVPDQTDITDDLRPYVDYKAERIDEIISLLEND